MTETHWIIQGLLIILGGFIGFAWKNLIHRVTVLEEWRLEIIKEIALLEEDAKSRRH